MRARPFRAIPQAGPGQRIGLFGGSFDPAHSGHALVAETALKRLGLHRVWWLAAPHNPLKHHGPAPVRERLVGMRRLARGRAMVVSDLQSQLGLLYTVEVLETLRRARPGVRFVWLMGADAMAGFHRWRRWRDILATTPILIVSRPGAALRVRSSPAFARFQSARTRPELLLAKPAPAWAFVHTRHDPASSTTLRQLRAG